MNESNTSLRGTREWVVTSCIALATVGSLLIMFALPAGAKSFLADHGEVLLIGLGVVLLSAGALLAWRLHVSLLTAPAGLVAGYMLFSFVFYVFIYDPR